MVLVGGILQQNPFFVPPDQFLEELRRRKEAKIVTSSASA